MQHELATTVLLDSCYPILRIRLKMSREDQIAFTNINLQLKILKDFMSPEEYFDVQRCSNLRDY